MFGIDESEYDVERLRSDLTDEFGAAANSGFPVAMVDIFDCEKATDEEIIAKALNMDYDLDRYRISREY